VLEQLCQSFGRLALAFLSGLNSRIAQAVRRIVMTATRTLKARHGILERISDCGQLRRAGLARRINCWTQASKVLCIECVQGCRDRRPDADDPFFYAWPKHRDPKFTAKN
jgi:hypothetical protein